MNDKQNAYYQMYSACVQVATANAATLGTYPPFDVPYQKFLGLYNNVPTLVQQQGTTTTGIALNKKAAEDAIVKKADKILIALRALAGTSEDNILKTKANIPHSALTHASDTELVGLAMEAHDLGNANITALAVYGVVAADLAALLTDIDAFTALLGAPRAARETPKEATAELGSVFEQCRRLLNEQMDPAIEAYGLSHPAIASAWKNARKLIMTGGHKLAMMIQVTDAATGEAIPGVSIEIMPDKEAKRTAAGGGCDIPHLTEGNKTIKASKAGYSDVTVDGAVTSGETDQIHIIMHPLA